MKNFFKLKVILLSFFIIFASQAYAGEPILPIPKPIPDKDTKDKTAKKKHIYPQEKPVGTKKITESDNSQKTSDLTLVEKEEIFIYPAKKPILIKPKKEEFKIVEKSSILSKRDFEIARSVFELVDKRKWKKAIKLSKKAKDKMIFKLVFWMYLKETTNSATFFDYLTFINNNPNYPRINRLKYLAEHKVNFNTVSPSVFLKWLNNQDPLSEFGKIKLGEVYIKQGNYEKGSKLIKEGWIKAKLSKSQLPFLDSLLVQI